MNPEEYLALEGSRGELEIVNEHVVSVLTSFRQRLIDGGYDEQAAAVMSINWASHVYFPRLAPKPVELTIERRRWWQR